MLLPLILVTSLIDPVVGVDLWKYRNFGERYYVDALVERLHERLTAWPGSFRVDGDEPVSYTHLTLPTILLV